MNTASLESIHVGIESAHDEFARSGYHKEARVLRGLEVVNPVSAEHARAQLQGIRVRGPADGARITVLNALNSYLS